MYLLDKQSWKVAVFEVACWCSQRAGATNLLWVWCRPVFIFQRFSRSFFREECRLLHLEELKGILNEDLQKGRPISSSNGKWGLFLCWQCEGKNPLVTFWTPEWNPDDNVWVKWCSYATVLLVYLPYRCLIQINIEYLIPQFFNKPTTFYLHRSIWTYEQVFQPKLCMCMLHCWHQLSPSACTVQSEPCDVSTYGSPKKCQLVAAQNCLHPEKQEIRFWKCTPVTGTAFVKEKNRYIFSGDRDAGFGLDCQFLFVMGNACWVMKKCNLVNFLLTDANRSCVSNNPRFSQTSVSFQAQKHFDLSKSKRMSHRAVVQTHDPSPPEPVLQIFTCAPSYHWRGRWVLVRPCGRTGVAQPSASSVIFPGPPPPHTHCTAQKLAYQSDCMIGLNRTATTLTGEKNLISAQNKWPITHPFSPASVLSCEELHRLSFVFAKQWKCKKLTQGFCCCSLLQFCPWTSWKGLWNIEKRKCLLQTMNMLRYECLSIFGRLIRNHWFFFLCEHLLSPTTTLSNILAMQTENCFTLRIRETYCHFVRKGVALWWFARQGGRRVCGIPWCPGVGVMFSTRHRVMFSRLWSVGT